MFPSNNSLHNPFFSSPSSSSSPYVDLSPFIIHPQDPNQIQNQNQNQNPLSFSPITISNNAVMCSSNGEFGNEYGFGEKRRPPKKDRHSKIYTAQGLRDRRVRMSIDIARKFFDLQDLLGFDKASKTLEWLLTKSQNAILQLSINSKTASSCEQENGDNMNSKDEKKMKKMKKKAAEASNAKEMREKARARARERTRLKMLLSTAKFNDSNLLINHLHQQSSSANCYVRPCHQEPEFVKKKPMMAYQQNLILFKDSNFNNNSSSNKNFPNLHLNSDSNSAAARCTVCGINTMRRSAGTYLWDKLWD